jgi:hypothetical protein
VSTLTGLFDDMVETLERFREASKAASKYREGLESDGWSPTVAEQMAHEAYQLLVAQAMGADVSEAVRRYNNGEGIQ